MNCGVREKSKERRRTSTAATTNPGRLFGDQRSVCGVLCGRRTSTCASEAAGDGKRFDIVDHRDWVRSECLSMMLSRFVLQVILFRIFCKWKHAETSMPENFTEVRTDPRLFVEEADRALQYRGHSRKQISRENAHAPNSIKFIEILLIFYTESSNSQ